MEMGAKGKIETIQSEGEIYACPACQYEDGFRVSFKRQAESKSGEVVLICPNCHKRFRLGFPVTWDQI